MTDEKIKLFDKASKGTKKAVKLAVDSAGKIYDEAGRVTGFVVDSAGKIYDEAGRATGFVVDSAGKVYDEAGKATGVIIDGVDKIVEKTVGRTKWNSNITFLLAMIGAAVGLGNIWRFPYIFYSNGQGAFLIPYIVAILVLGLPFMLLEYSIGRKFNDTLLNSFRKVNPKYQVVAWVIMIVSFLVATYYLTIVGWDLNYFVLSFTKGWGANPDYFFNNVLLQSQPGTSGVFTIIPYILIAVLILWVITWFISHRGLNDGIGKFTSFFVPLLFILGIGIAVYEVLLPGSYIGLQRFFTPNWSLLADPNIWLAAFGQILFTLSLGMGVVISYSSHLDNDVNLTKNAAIVIFANCGFEIINAIGVFSVLGYMAYSTGMPFDSLVTKGSGLAFVSLPQVFNVLGGPGYILGILFFFCIIIAGITTSISYIEPLVDTVNDKFNLTRSKAVTILAIVGFLLSIIYTTASGNYFIEIIDGVLNNIILVLFVIVQCVIFGYLYNIDSLMEVLNHNSLFRVGNWWKYLIKYIIPIFLGIIWIMGFYEILTTVDTTSMLLYVFVIIAVVIVSFILHYVSNKRDSITRG